MVENDLEQCVRTAAERQMMSRFGRAYGYRHRRVAVRRLLVLAALGAMVFGAAVHLWGDNRKVFRTTNELFGEGAYTLINQIIEAK